MALPSVSTLPTAPLRSVDDRETYAEKAEAWVSGIELFATEIQTFGAAVVAQAVATNYNATSTSSVTVGTGDKTFVTAAGTLLQPGQAVTVARTSAAATTIMIGTVKSFTGNASTPGTMVVTVASIVGSGGPFTDWTIALAAGSGAVQTTGNQTMYGGLWLNTTSPGAVRFANNHDITGAVSAYANATNSTVLSDVTTAANGYNTFIGTQAAAFTLANLYHYQANQATIGAGSTVTQQIGFLAGSTLVGATNNFGFYGNIASGANRWNFYAGGSASNYFNGLTYFGNGIFDNATGNDIGGYKGSPINAQNSNYTLVLTDQGKTIYSKNAGAQTVTVPTNASVALPLGTVVSIINNGTTSITISTTGITMYHAGTANSGNRTLAAKGWCTIEQVEANVWFITGAGLT